MTMPKNIDAEPLPVLHSKLTRWTEDSAFKSECPACEHGVLLVHRDDNLKLKRDDRCISCGQRVHYLDDEIGGEKLPPAGSAS